jgi:hypothetical protein
MTTPQTQLEGFVADVLLPRIDEVMEAATNGVNESQLRQLFDHNIGSGLQFFYNRWTPVYLSSHGQEKTSHAQKTLDALCQEVRKADDGDLHTTIVKTLWYLLSLSLEDMDNVPVFPDELTFSQLETAIKSATHRIN